MDMITFLRRILPPDGNGNYVILEIPQGAKSGWNVGPFTTIEELADAATLQDKTTKTIFYAVGTFKDNVVGKKVSRKKEFAHKFKSMCVDLDVGGDHVYQTQKEAYTALVKAAIAIGIPKPLTVKSGRGLHCYWPLNEVISAAAWEKVGMQLRAVLQHQGVDLDTTKIHDTSMVLRPVGTHHKKDPDNIKEVTVLVDCEDVSVIDFMTALKKYSNANNIHVGVPHKPKATRAPVGSLIGAVLNNSYDKHNIHHLVAGCKQLTIIAADGGASCKHDMWWHSLNIAKNCTDVEEAITILCGGHSEFNMQTSLDKMRTSSFEGSTKCSSFEAVNPSGCAGCPLRGKDKSPASFSRGTPEVVVAEVKFAVPAPYAIKDGAIIREFMDEKNVENEEGKKSKVEFMNTEVVSPYLIYVESRYTDADHETSVAHVNVKYPIGGWRKFDLPLATLWAGGAEFQKLLGEKEIIITALNGEQKLRKYLMSYLAFLQQTSDTSYKYSHFGWQKDGTFLLGHRLLGDAGHRDFKLAGATNQFASKLQKVGSYDLWKRAINCFGTPGLELHGCFFLMGMGGPLLAGGSIKSCLLHMYSADSGSGKTATQKAIMSVWGSPSLMMSVKDTENSIYKSLGVLRNLTACMDEMTELINEEQAVAHDFAYHFSLGKEKARLNSSMEFRDQEEWEMPVVWSSNADLEGQLDNRVISNGIRMRLFQGYFPTNEFFSDMGRSRDFVRAFDHNYGHAAEELVSEILRVGKENIYDAADARLERKYKFKFPASERHIRAMFIVADAIGEVASNLGIISFDYEACVYRGMQELTQKRSAAISSHRDAIDLLGQFWLENNRYMVESIAEQTTGSKPKIKLPTPDYATVRVETVRNAGTPVSGQIHNNRAMLRKWIQSQGGDYDAMLKGLTRLGVRFIDNNRISIMKGCDKTNPGQTYCLTIEMNHPRIITAMSHPDIVTTSDPRGASTMLQPTA